MIGNPMRIVHVLNHCNHGHGNAHVAIDLACAQARAGHEVFYVSEGGDYANLLAAEGVQLVDLRQNLRAPGVAFTAFSKLAAFCKRTNPHIVHAHMMSGAVLGYLATRFTQTRLITTVHNSFDRHSVLMRLGDRIVAVSNAEKKLLESRDFNPARVDVVLNGPNQSPREMAAAISQNLTLARPCITTVCGIHRRKGVADLLHAFRRVTEVTPEWFLNVIGDGPDRAEMEELARSLHLEEKVSFLGNVPHVRPALEQSEIFVLASYADPCSLALAEARYAGCALVATEVGGTPELLGFGCHGALVPPGNHVALAAALLELTGDAEKLAFRRGAAKEGSEYLTNSRLYHDYQQVYESALTR